MGNRIVAISWLVAMIIMLGMMNLVAPSDIGPVGVLVFFILFYLISFDIYFLFVKLIRRILVGKKDGGLEKKYYWYAIIASFGNVLFLLMNSFRLDFWLTVFGAAIFVIFGCFFVNKKDSL